MTSMVTRMSCGTSRSAIPVISTDLRTSIFMEANHPGHAINNWDAEGQAQVLLLRTGRQSTEMAVVLEIVRLG